MSKTIFVNLPVKDVNASADFYAAIGFIRDPRFTDPGGGGAAMIWSDTISFMLVSRELYSTLTEKPIADTQATSAVLIALSLESRDEVDRITQAAISAGGREAHPPEDHGFMYSRAFWDLDGHGFGPMWMDPDQAMPVTAEQEAAAQSPAATSA